MKRAISVLVILAMMIASVLVVVPVSAAGAVTEITSADDFLNMNSTGTYILANDITIREPYSGTFAGTFDGNNKTITLAGTATSVFYSINGGIVKNVKIAGNVTGEDITANYGALSPEASNCTIDGVNSAVSFTIAGEDDKADIFTGAGVGGIVGVAGDKTVVKNCVNSGNITVKCQGGDLAADANNHKESVGEFGLGGIVGKAYTTSWGTVTIDNCSSSGTLTTYQTRANVGGIIGMFYLTSGVVRKSANTGKINYTQTVYPTNAQSYQGVGGIVGSTRFTGDKDAASSVIIYGCNNGGAITVNNSEGSRNIWAGGILGRALATPNITISACNNTAKIVNNSEEGDWSAAGGIVGTFMSLGHGWTNTFKGDIKVLNCVNNGVIEASKHAAGILALSVEMASEDIKLTIEGCENKQTVTSKSHNAGGIVASMGYATYDKLVNGSIKNCINTANIGNSTTTGTNAGGIIAYFGAMGNGTFTIDKCYNSGTITAKPSGGVAGGIAGALVNGSKFTVSNCGSSKNGTVAQGTGMGGSNNTTTVGNITKAIDATDLDYLIASANTLKEEDYSASTWSDLTSAKATAESASAAKASQSAIDSAANALEAAINGLGLEEVDTTALAALVAEAKEIEKNEAKYTIKTYKKVINALYDAEAALASPYQSVIDAAAAALQEAIDGLADNPKYDPNKQPANKDEGNTDNGNSNSGNTGNTDNGNTDSGNTDNGNTNNGSSNDNGLGGLVPDSGNNSATTPEGDDGAGDVEGDVEGEGEGDVEGEGEGEAEGEGETEPAKKKGCGSSIAATAVVLSTVIALGAGVTFRKKED